MLAWVGDGIFTSDDDEPIWGIAHRILLPAFSNQGTTGHRANVRHNASLESFPLLVLLQRPPHRTPGGLCCSRLVEGWWCAL